ncbi:sensor histidine kinase [Streptomyces sp. NPDC102283]|uniref:sensor histidine kinase n=1 Tax=Streptomyces sp. NPDC102283 TaxID=3366155 RepID=UPI00382ED5CB
MNVPDSKTAEAHDPAPRIAVSITGIILLGHFGVAVTLVLRAGPSPLETCTDLFLLALLLVLQVGSTFPGLRPAGRRWVVLALAAQAVLTYVPFLFLHDAWLGMPGFLAGSILLHLRPALAWSLFFLVVLASGLALVALGHALGDIACTTVATVLTNAVVFGMSRLTRLVREAHAARVELAELVIEQERLRVSRDLHDLLGYSLSTITVKGELAYRLIPEEYERAREEVRDVLHASRRAMADVRAVARGHVAMSLATELRMMESLFAALGIRLESRVEAGEPPPTVDVLLATVLREGLTNILRHAGAKTCRIDAWREDGHVWLVLWNDGVDAKPGVLGALDKGGGSGIGNLRARVEALGGVFAVNAPEKGTFELAVRVPLTTGAGFGRIRLSQPVKHGRGRERAARGADLL